MRKYVVPLVSASIAVAALAGCGGGSAGGSVAHADVARSAACADAADVLDTMAYRLDNAHDTSTARVIFSDTSEDLYAIMRAVKNPSVATAIRAVGDDLEKMSYATDPSSAGFDKNLSTLTRVCRIHG